MGFTRFDAFFGKRFGGILRGNFGGPLDRAEVEKVLEQELMRRRRKSRQGAHVPNVFELRLATEDHQRLSSRRFLEELYVFVEKALILSDSFMDGKLSIHLVNVPDMKLGHCGISSRYADDREESPVAEQAASTMVLARSSFVMPLNLPPVRQLATLTVIEGPDEATVLEFGEKKIYIGRREKNELCLTDAKTSRLHASIDYERHRHVLRDAGSLNGTFLNEERVQEAVLQDGDEIRAGGTRLLYEVL